MGGEYSWSLNHQFGELLGIEPGQTKRRAPKQLAPANDPDRTNV